MHCLRFTRWTGAVPIIQSSLGFRRGPELLLSNIFHVPNRTFAEVDGRKGENDVDSRLKTSSISEQNKERAQKYLDRDFPSSSSPSSSRPGDTGKLSESEDLFDPALVLGDDEHGARVDGGDGYTRGLKRDAKQEALKRVTKYMPIVSGTVPTLETMQKLLENDHGATDIRILDVREKASFADWMIIATGLSNTHVVAIADGLQKDMCVAGVKVADKQVTLCGRDDGDWVVVDIGNVIVHVMTEESRSHYDLEGVWDGDGGVEDNDEENDVGYEFQDEKGKVTEEFVEIDPKTSERTDRQ